MAPLHGQRQTCHHLFKKEPLLSVPCLIVIIRYPPAHCWTSRQLNHSWPEKRGILETMSLYLFPFAQTTKRAGGLMMEEAADVQKIKKWPRANRSLLSPWTGGLSHVCCMSALNFLHFCFNFVLFIPIAKQTNPLLGFYFIIKYYKVKLKWSITLKQPFDEILACQLSE